MGWILYQYHLLWESSLLPCHMEWYLLPLEVEIVLIPRVWKSYLLPHATEISVMTIKCDKPVNWLNLSSTHVIFLYK